MTRKTVFLLSSVCSLLICSLTNITISYLTDHNQLDNTVKIGHNNTSIEETFPTPEPIDPDTPQNYQKIVSVTNADSVPCYIRILVAFSDNAIGDAVTFINLNGTDWEYVENNSDTSLNGYYYYKYPVAPGESTAPLFEGLTIAGGLDFSTVNTSESFQVILYEESLQCDPSSSYLSAWKDFIRA